jgi:Flp pilus assembly protein TadD
MKEAVKTLRQATSADASYPEPHYALSRIYRRQGQVAEADEALSTFTRLRNQREQVARQEPVR